MAGLYLKQLAERFRCLLFAGGKEAESRAEACCFYPADGLVPIDREEIESSHRLGLSEDRQLVCNTDLKFFRIERLHQVIAGT